MTLGNRAFNEVLIGIDAHNIRTILWKCLIWIHLKCRLRLLFVLFSNLFLQYFPLGAFRQLFPKIY